MYYVIYAGEEDNVHLRVMTRREVLEELNNPDGEFAGGTIWTESGLNQALWVDLQTLSGEPPNIIIIEGNVVEPQVVQKVIKYTIP